LKPTRLRAACQAHPRRPRRQCWPHFLHVVSKYCTCKTWYSYHGKYALRLVLFLLLPLSRPPSYLARSPKEKGQIQHVSLFWILYSQIINNVAIFTSSKFNFRPNSGNREAAILPPTPNYSASLRVGTTTGGFPRAPPSFMRVTSTLEVERSRHG
jgi:hypothetical protein